MSKWDACVWVDVWMLWSWFSCAAGEGSVPVLHMVVLWDVLQVLPFDVELRLHEFVTGLAVCAAVW